MEAQWVKGWPADLAVLGLIPAEGGHHFICKQGSISQTLSLLHPHCLDILLKKM